MQNFQLVTIMYCSRMLWSITGSMSLLLLTAFYKYITEMNYTLEVPSDTQFKMCKLWVQHLVGQVFFCVELSSSS